MLKSYELRIFAQHRSRTWCLQGMHTGRKTLFDSMKFYLQVSTVSGFSPTYSYTSKSLKAA